MTHSALDLKVKTFTAPTRGGVLHGFTISSARTRQTLTSAVGFVSTDSRDDAINTRLARFQGKPPRRPDPRIVEPKTADAVARFYAKYGAIA